MLIIFRTTTSIQMSSKYKPGDDAIPHFLTFSVVGWIDVLTKEGYKEVIIESLKYCQEHKGLILQCWVIMSNYIHLIISSETKKINIWSGISRNIPTSNLFQL